MIARDCYRQQVSKLTHAAASQIHCSHHKLGALTSARLPSSPWFACMSHSQVCCSPQMKTPRWTHSISRWVQKHLRSLLVSGLVCWYGWSACSYIHITFIRCWAVTAACVCVCVYTSDSNEAFYEECISYYLTSKDGMCVRHKVDFSTNRWHSTTDWWMCFLTCNSSNSIAAN